MDSDRPRYGDEDFDYVALAEWEYEHDRTTPPVTWADAHHEWHTNAGVPMGQPGCPWDACHPEPEPWETFTPLTLDDFIQLHEIHGVETVIQGDIWHPAPPPPDDEDLPF